MEGPAGRLGCEEEALLAKREKSFVPLDLPLGEDASGLTANTEAMWRRAHDAADAADAASIAAQDARELASLGAALLDDEEIDRILNGGDAEAAADFGLDFGPIDDGGFDL